MPEDWAAKAAVETFAPTAQSKPLHAGALNITVDTSGDLALFGGSEGTAGVFSVSQNKLVQEMTVGAPVTNALWAGNAAVIATSAGTIKAFENDTEKFSFSEHNGAVTALALHPCGDILASVGIDKTYVFYDLSGPSRALQVSTNSGKMLF